MQLVCVDGAVFVRVEGDAIYQTEKIVRLNAQTLATETEFSCDGLDIQGMGKAEDGALLLISGEYLLRPDFDAGKLTAILHWADNANTSVNNYRSVLETESGFLRGTAMSRLRASTKNCQKEKRLKTQRLSLSLQAPVRMTSRLRLQTSRNCTRSTV